MRILALTHRLPYAPNRGDRLRAYHILRELREHGDVELVSLVHDDEEASHVEEMRAVVPRVTALRVTPVRSRINACFAMLTGKPLTHALLDAAGIKATLKAICEQRPPDVVFAYCSGMARFAMQSPLEGVPFVLDLVDVDSQKWRELSAATRGPKSWIYRREAAKLGAFEARAAYRAAVTLLVNQREVDVASALAPGANIQVLPNGVELERLRPIDPPLGAPRVVFCGVMSYAPNAEGMTWFVERVWPLVRETRSDATLAVVGPDPSDAFRSLCAPDPSITITGKVPDVRDWLWQSAVAVAPLHVARGLQNKALEAIAAGLPVVLTDAVANGLPREAAPASRVANDPASFAKQVIDLLSKSPDERRAIAASADLSRITWSHTLAPLWPIFESAAQRSKLISSTPSISTKTAHYRSA